MYIVHKLKFSNLMHFDFSKVFDIDVYWILMRIVLISNTIISDFVKFYFILLIRGIVPLSPSAWRQASGTNSIVICVEKILQNLFKWHYVKVKDVYEWTIIYNSFTSVNEKESYQESFVLCLYNFFLLLFT